MNRHSHQGNHGGGKFLFGIIIILIGIGIFLKHAGLLPYLHLRATWPLILIVVGIFVGFRNGFFSPGPVILIGIGVFNLIPAFSFNIGNRSIDSEDLVVPFLLVAGGIMLIFRSGRPAGRMKFHPSAFQNGDTVQCEAVFGGRREIITSRNFKGGRVSATFGGCEINMIQADSPEKNIFLEIRTTFGGCELIIPANWEVKNELETAFGSVEDKRSFRPGTAIENQKTLILRGSCFFGGVEIKSF